MAAGLLAAVFLTVLAGTAVMALRIEPGVTPPPADLIVVLGGDSDRMPYARRLVEAGLAPRAVSTLYDPRCLEAGGSERECASGVRNTVDEALYTRFVLAAAGVRNLTVVTSDYHVRRAGVVFRIVFLGSGIGVSLASPGGPRSPAAPSGLRETAKLVPSAGAAMIARVSPSMYCWLTACRSSES
ncbi:MAG TPA: YdcF family protein [Thermodesulfobacteriota bacterium]